MVKEPVRLKFSSVKAVVRSAMGNYQIHGAKIGFYFGIRKWDFGFLGVAYFFSRSEINFMILSRFFPDDIHFGSFSSIVQ